MPHDPSAAVVKAIEANTRELRNIGRVLEAINTNIVELAKRFTNTEPEMRPPVDASWTNQPSPD